MFIRTTHRKYKGKTYKSVSLVESYRDKGKIKHRLISNITGWGDPLISQFQLLLKGKINGTVPEFTYNQGKSCGALIVLKEICKRTGISKSLGYGKEAKLAMLQVSGRIINQGSRLKLANEWVLEQAIAEVLGIEKVDEDDLYHNLDWLSHNQKTIENKLFAYRCTEKKEVTIYLYDVTSTYFEGTQNELSQFGYNRDGKKGKKQIVIGLLCDQKGYPISVEVFEGNTIDNKTVQAQLEKLQERFHVSKIIFVGDKGMLKSVQIEQVKKMDWYYISSITQPQIKTLLNQGVIQLSMFDDKIVEVEFEGERYIIRQNPVRKKEIVQNRESRISFVIRKIAEKNDYLKIHTRAKKDTALRQLEALVNKRKLTGVVQVIDQGDEISYVINQAKKKEAGILDGCYVIKTDVPKEIVPAQTIHDRYKDLAEVEHAFRTFKTGHEEIRPVYVRKKDRTRGHVLICMLGYIVLKYFWDKCKDLGYTLDFIVKSLDNIQYINYNIDGVNIKLLPNKLLPEQQQILDRLGIELPARL